MCFTRGNDMLIRISLCLLFIYACSSGEFKGHQIDKSADQTGNPQPPPITPTPECLKTCEAACEAWGEWIAWSPATDTVCKPTKGGKLTQSRTRTRTCQATCANVTCPKTETEQQEVDGTRDCTDPPPPCQTSCTTGCKAWSNWSAWSPSAVTMCKDDQFTQTRARTRSCFPTCDDKAECLCSGVQCDTTTNKSQTATGSKVIDCQTACDAYTWGEWSPQATAAEVCTGQTVAQTRTGTRTCPRDDCKTCDKTTTKRQTLKGTKVTDCEKDCTPWQAVTGVTGVWSPARDTVPLGDEFKQTRTEKRTCSEVCPGSACDIKRTNTQDAEGTKQPPPPPPPPPEPEVETPTPPPPPVETTPTCNSCSAGCEAWQDWGAWTAESRCPTTIAFGTKLLAAGKEHRSRTRTCDNDLCADTECFTSNAETRTTPCACPEGKVLAEDDTCVCDSARRQYKVGNACQQCPSDYNLKQVNGIWTCEQTCACCEDWEQTGVSQQASEVCKNSQFTPVYTYERTCDNCPPGNTCLLTKTEASQPVQGTKTTKNCEDHCTDWSAWDWTATEACPPTNSSFTKSSATYAGTRTRTCTGLCSASDCAATDNSGRDTRACEYCQGTGQKILNQGTSTESCVCDEAKHYYKKDNTCILCEPPKKFRDGKCVCDEAKHYYKKDNTCILCEPPKKFQDGECVEEATSNVKSPDDASEEGSTPPPKVETCAEGCGDWEKDWSTWKLTTAECPADTTSFTQPTPAAEKATRTRTRVCENLPAGLECFTSNTETRTTICGWCQGEGQKFDDGVCVCDADSNYYKDAHYDDRCTSCGDKVVNAKGDGCVCAESSCINSKKTWNSDTCSCGECKQEVADACYPGSLDANCTCISVAEPEAETTIAIKIYNGCFSTAGILQLFSGYSSGTTLLKKFPTDQGWKFEECFESDIDDYNEAVGAIISEPPSDSVQAVIQKLYDCAKNRVDKKNINDAKGKFIEQLTDNDTRDCKRSNKPPNINVEITP